MNLYQIGDDNFYIAPTMRDAVKMAWRECHGQATRQDLTYSCMRWGEGEELAIGLCWADMPLCVIIPPTAIRYGSRYHDSGQWYARFYAPVRDWIACNPPGPLRLLGMPV